MADSPRVISLVPNATEIVSWLGCGDWLVGRSHECDFPPGVEDLPVCTYASLDSSASSREIDDAVKSLLRNALSIYGLHTDTINELQPTHLITQAQCDVCAVSLRDVEAAAGETFTSSPRITACEPHTLDDVFADIARVAADLELPTVPFDQKLAGLKARLGRLAESPRTGRTMLCVEWTDPPMVAGNWVPRLVEIAGAKPLLATDGGHSPYLTDEQIVASEPDLIVFMPCGFDLARTDAETRAVLPQPPWSQLRAVASGDVFTVDGNAFFNRPGPRVVDSAEILREILDARPEDDGNTRWRRVRWLA